MRRLPVQANRVGFLLADLSDVSDRALPDVSDFFREPCWGISLSSSRQAWLILTLVSNAARCGFRGVTPCLLPQFPLNQQPPNPPMPTKYTLLDDHGQPVARFGFLRDNNLAKAFDQLAGLCKGILCDGIVTDEEARFFHEWVKAHTNQDTIWPFNDILARLDRIFADGVVDTEEREELTALMHHIIGGAGDDGAVSAEDSSTGLPLDDPAPSDIVFPGSEFCVTGKFAFGARKRVTEAIESRGGSFNDTPRKQTRFLVIGFHASRDWKYSSYGTKIERAVELRSASSGIRIVAEEHWRRFLR